MIKFFDILIFFITVISTLDLVFATEFTFELPDSTDQCFHEIIQDKTLCTIEFQVSKIILERKTIK